MENENLIRILVHTLGAMPQCYNAGSGEGHARRQHGGGTRSACRVQYYIKTAVILVLVDVVNVNMVNMVCRYEYEFL